MLAQVSQQYRLTQLPHIADCLLLLLALTPLNAGAHTAHMLLTRCSHWMQIAEGTVYAHRLGKAGAQCRISQIVGTTCL